MDEETRTKVAALLSKTLAELTVAEAIFLALTLDDVDDEDFAALIGEAPGSGSALPGS